MTYAPFLVVPKYSHPPIGKLLTHHGFAIVVTVCIVFWAVVATGMYFAL